MSYRLIRGALILVALAASACGGGDDDNDENGGGGGSGNSPGGSFGGGFNLGGANSGGGNTGTTCNGQLIGRVRDFHDNFPDMEPAHSGKSDNASDPGIVKDTIGEDSKPVYNGPAAGTLTTTGKENFDQWFRDVERVNQPMELPLQFVDPDKDGVFTYDNQTFFPIDNQLFGNEGRAHNYHFTFELHTLFQYKGGERFRFIGDDDVFTFINGKLVVDLGGVHGALEKEVQLDTLGLTKGETYPLDFFFAERHVTDSHFRIDTTIQFVNCGIQVE